MRKLVSLFIVVLLFSLLITSCDKTIVPAAPSLIGTWKYSGRTGTQCTDPADEFSEPCSGGTEECGSLTITATGYTYTPPTGSGDPVETGTYTVDGSTLLVTPTGGLTVSFAYTVIATTMTLGEVNASTGCVETTTLTKI